MSTTDVFPIDPDGSIETVWRVPNAWGGAMAVWTGLAQKYVPEYEVYEAMMDGYKKVIALAKDPRIERWERIVLLTTCDGALVKAENFGKVAEAFETFYAEHKKYHEGKVFHIDKQAELLRRLEKEREEKGWRGVGWNQTSVNGDCLWYGTYDDEDEHTSYNIDRDDKHWYIMDDVAKIESELAKDAG